MDFSFHGRKESCILAPSCEIKIYFVEKNQFNFFLFCKKKCHTKHENNGLLEKLQLIFFLLQNRLIPQMDGCLPVADLTPPCGLICRYFLSIF